MPSIKNCNKKIKGVGVVKWQEAGILSQQPKFDSRLGRKNKKRDQKPLSVPLMTSESKAYFKK